MPIVIGVNEIEMIRNDLAGYKSSIESGEDNVRRIIEMFKGDPTVASLFRSGNFGRSNEEKLEELLTALDDYKYQVAEALCTRTEQFLTEQEIRLNRVNM